MSNQQPIPNLMSSRRNTKRDNTRILSNLSSDSRVVPARAKSAPSRNKILVSLIVLIALAGATAWFMTQRAGIPTPAPSVTHADTPTQTAPDITVVALPTLPEPQAALIENVPDTDDTSKKDVTPPITTSLKPFAALTEDTPAKTNNAKPVEKMANVDQKPIAKNAAKNGTPAPSSQKAGDEADVAIISALIQSTKSPASTEKIAPKKTPAVAERLKRCQKLGKKEAARCKVSKP